jgi:hypothetical protein
MRGMHRQGGLAGPGIPSIARTAATPPAVAAPATAAVTFLDSSPQSVNAAASGGSV